MEKRPGNVKWKLSSHNMECKITSTSKKTRRSGGFTLLELMVGVSIGFTAITAVTMLSIYTARSFAAVSNYMELDKNSRNTLDRMTQIVREADGVTSYNGQSIVLSYHGQRLSFDYSKDAKLLTLSNTNNVKTKLLTGCDYL